MERYYRKNLKLSRFCLNSFRLNGLDQLDAGYRLIRYSGLLETDDDYEKKVRLLANILGGDLKLPVEPIRLDQERLLAVMGERQRLAEISVREGVSLNPDRVTIHLDKKLHPLSFQNGSRIQSKLAHRALLWAIDGLASKSSDWWSYDRRYISRTPDEGASSDQIQVYPAFYFGLVPGSNGVLELVIDPSVCYVERYSLHEKYGNRIPTSVVGNRYLYKYGTDWYKIDALGISNSADREMMNDPDTGKSISIWERIVNVWGGKGLPLIDGLSPDSPTIAYKTRGQKSRRAHSGLLFELVGVGGNDEGEPSPHEESIMSPSIRGRRTQEIIYRTR